MKTLLILATLLMMGHSLAYVNQGTIPAYTPVYTPVHTPVYTPVSTPIPTVYGTIDVIYTPIYFPTVVTIPPTRTAIPTVFATINPTVISTIAITRTPIYLPTVVTIQPTRTRTPTPTPTPTINLTIDPTVIATIAITRTPIPTSTPEPGICCFTRSLSIVTRMANPALIKTRTECENKNGEWLVNAVTCPVTTPPPEFGVCCKRQRVHTHSRDRMINPAQITKEMCDKDPSMEWQRNPSCQYIDGGGGEFGVCCDSSHSPVRVTSSSECNPPNIWKRAITCREFSPPPRPSQSTPQVPVDPGASEQVPCRNYLVINQGITLQGCMEKKGQFNSYRGQQICCIQ